MTIVAANSAGISNKKESLLRIINHFKPIVLFLQETKLGHKGKLKLKDYNIFENLRNNSAGGGLLTAVHESLEPVSVSEDESEELLVVEAKLGSIKSDLLTGTAHKKMICLSSEKTFTMHLT